MQKFYKGRTNNHLTWAFVDATDYATPESALSAAAKIKIYGKLRGGTGTNFVSSGTGSLTNDITHVGASALGLYTIALVKADLSDASAAWYDQYIVSLSATGAAYVALVAEGVIDESNLSGVISDIYSALVVGNSRVLVAQSAASDAASAAAQANSRVLLVQSRLSDFDSRLVSDLSDVLSQLTVVQSMASDAASAAQQGNSRILLVQSRLSDFDSRTVSDLSDILSAVNVGNSRVLLNQSRISDIASYLVVMSGVQSDIYSALSDAHSDLASKIGGITAAVSASDISDIASAVWANTIGARVDSRVLVAQSYLSDIRSHVSDLQSDFQSRVPKRVATDSQLSDVHSDIASRIGAITASVSASDISDIASAVWAAKYTAHSVASSFGSLLSDLYSRVVLVQSAASDAASAAQQVNSRVLLVLSAASDTYSLLSDLQSDFQSRVPKRVATDSQLSDLASDLRSVAVVAQSSLSDIYSLLSDVQSDFQSRVPKRVATDSQLSDLHSDLRSLAGANHSAASDIYSLLSDLHSDVGVVSGVVSDIYSLVVAGAPLGASDLSDIRSAITANGVLRPGADPTAVVGVTAPLADKVDWLAALSRNRLDQTATQQKLHNDALSQIASAVVSDDGTTFRRDEWAG